MTYFLLILSIFFWPFGQLLTFSFLGQSFNYYLLDLVLGLLTLSLFLSAKNRRLITSDPLFKPLVVFLFAASLSLLFNFKYVLSGGLIYPLFYLLRLFIYPSLYFAVKLYSGPNLSKAIVFSLVLFSLLGLAQYLFLPDMRYLKLIGFDDHYYRLIGSLYDPNFTGAIFAGVALVLIATGQLLLSLFFVGLLALTFSRASFLCFGAGLLYLLFKKRQKKILFFLFILSLLIWLTPKPFGEGVNLLRTFSIFSRLGSWQGGLTLFSERPILGWGYNTLRNIIGSRFQIDNSYLYLAATTGIIGLSAFIYLLYKSWSVLSSLPARLFFLTILIHSLFNNSLFFIWISFAYWLALGLGTKAYKKE